MANRFERLFQLPEKQYIAGSPVILVAGVLSKDTETGSIIAQLKFQSVSEKRIKAVKVSLTAYDVSKAEVQGVTDYQYLELNVGNGQEFGSNKAVVMPISVTRSFAVASILVVFNDGSMWESTGNFSVLPAVKSLSFTLGSAEMEKQYRIATNDSATYAPSESQDLWQCSCGTWNKETTCTHCSLLKSKVFSALDVTTLTEQMNIRLVKEQEQREAEAARQAQLQAEAAVRRKKNKKRLTIVAIIVLIAAILLTIGIVVYNKLTELTIEKLLSLYTQDDVTSLLGEPDNAEYNSYDVKFMGEKFYLAFDYDGNELTDFSLVYHYPGTEDLETAGDLLDYKITSRDRESANKILDEVMSSFKEKYGSPKVFNSEVDTITYTWIINNRMIELYDYTDNDDMGSMFGAFSIDVNCDHQSFCEHTDTEAEHKDATCTENGYDRTTCTICGYIDETTITALGHENITTITKQPTCAVEGEKTHQCSVCGATEKESIATLPHNNQSAVTKDPTCTVEGVKTHTCTECSNVAEEKIEKIPHNYVETVTKQAGCTTTGTKIQKCSVCGDAQNAVTIPALGHDYGQYKIDEATCTTNGTRYMKCTNCGDEYTDVIEAFGHNWKDATCTKAKHCINCGLTDGNPLGHEWDDFFGSVYCTICDADYYPQTRFVIRNLPTVTQYDALYGVSYTISVTSVSVYDYNLFVDYYGNITTRPQFDLYYDVTCDGEKCACNNFYIEFTVYNSSGNIVHEQNIRLSTLLGQGKNEWVYTHTEMPEGDTYYIELKIVI